MQIIAIAASAASLLVPSRIPVNEGVNDAKAKNDITDMLAEFGSKVGVS